MEKFFEGLFGIVYGLLIVGVGVGAFGWFLVQFVGAMTDAPVRKDLGKFFGIMFIICLALLIKLF